MLACQAVRPAHQQHWTTAASTQVHQLQSLWQNAIRLAAPVAAALALLLQPAQAGDLTIKFKGSPDPARQAAQQMLVEAWGESCMLLVVLHLSVRYGSHTNAVWTGYANLQFLDQEFNGLDWQAELQVSAHGLCTLTPSHW